ncbi:MAG: disulfide bond formation protein B [Ilumatobacteraceae bacterium]
MDRETAQLFFTLLTIGALVSTIAILMTRIAARTSNAARVLVDQLGPVSNAVAATLAVVSMLGSLYFSEVADYLPCTLCWYQRIAMYSLALVLTIAAFRRDRGIRVYAIPLASVGAGIALYHWLLERFPDIDAGVCSVTVPCEFVWFERVGFITLPFMALTGFVAIIAWLTLPSFPLGQEQS